MTRLDRIDLEILKILQKDSRKTISEIADMMELSRPTVRKRIKKMIGMGIIKRFTIIVDDSIVSGIKVLFRFKVSDIEKILKYLRNMEEFIELYLTGGEKNILGIAVYQDMEKFRNAMNKFLDLNIPFETEIIVKEIKRREDYIPTLCFKLTCDYCGKDIEGEPFKYTLYNRDFYFCCQTCLNNFRRMREV